MCVPPGDSAFVSSVASCRYSAEIAGLLGGRNSKSSVRISRICGWEVGDRGTRKVGRSGEGGCFNTRFELGNNPRVSLSPSS